MDKESITNTQTTQQFKKFIVKTFKKVIEKRCLGEGENKRKEKVAL